MELAALRAENDQLHQAALIEIGVYSDLREQIEHLTKERDGIQWQYDSFSSLVAAQAAAAKDTFDRLQRHARIGSAVERLVADCNE